MFFSLYDMLDLFKKMEFVFTKKKKKRNNDWDIFFKM